LATLRRLKELEDGGLSPKVAAEQISDKLKNTELDKVIALLEQAQVQAMLLANSDGRQRISRLAALRIVFLGQ